MAVTATPAIGGYSNSGQALNAMDSYQKSMQTPQQLLQSSEQQLGTDAAQQQVTGLQGAIANSTKLLANVAPSVMGRTANSLVTSAQANSQIANEQAPINQQLNQEQQDYGQASTNYSDLLQKAEDLANSNLTSQQDKLGYLQNIYQALYGREQDAKAAALQAQQLAEQKREFNASLGASGSGSSSGLGGLGALLGGSGGTGSTASSGGSQALQATQREDNGFSFTNGNTPINALQFANASKQWKGNFYGLLKFMAQHGDKGAKLGLTFIGNDGNADPRKVNTPEMQALYHALTGRNVAITQPSNLNQLSF